MSRNLAEWFLRTGVGVRVLEPQRQEVLRLSKTVYNSLTPVDNALYLAARVRSSQ